MKRMIVMCLAVVLPCVAAQAQSAPTLHNVNAGVLWDTVQHPSDPYPGTSSPGTPFALDFASAGLGALASSPYNTADITLSFECQTPYTSLNIQLDSAPGTVFTFSPTAPSSSDTITLLYNPEYFGVFAPAGAEVMPEAWKDELADGVLSGHLWMEGTPFQPQWAALRASGSFVSSAAPEPATLSALALGALCLLRRRRPVVLQHRQAHTD